MAQEAGAGGVAEILRGWSVGAAPGFPGSTGYWEQRYQARGSSGFGSRGVLARYKAEFVNRFIAAHSVRSVIDFGTGDGVQLELLECPRYLGLDVSRTAIRRLRRLFRHDRAKRFHLYAPGMNLRDRRAELALSMDVIYHLIEDEVYERYMRDLFSAAERYVIIYSSNFNLPLQLRSHVCDRRFTTLVREREPHWKLIRKARNPFRLISRSDFYLFERR